MSGPEFKKNEIITVKITDIGNSGEGIGKIEGYPFFIKDAVIGDTVRAKVTKTGKSYAYAVLEEVVLPSQHRVIPKCALAKSCGGCQLQFMDYGCQLEYKSRKVYNNITRIGGLGDFVMRPIIGADNGGYEYRNKEQFPVGEDKNGNIIYGFYAARTHSIINTSGCALSIRLGGVDINSLVMSYIKKFMEEEGIAPYNENTGNGLVRHVLIRIGKNTGQVMVCVVINGTSIPHRQKLVDMLSKIPGMTDISLNINKKNTNVIMGDRVISLYGPGYIEDTILGVRFRISPKSFFQVNPTQTEKLYKVVEQYAKLTGSETVWDLYCGIGSISLCLAKNAKKVLGVEIVPEAIQNAKENAKINKIDNVEFITGAVKEVVPKYFKEHGREDMPDVVVLDPPRKGCERDMLDTIIKVAPSRIVYVSCDSATLARDLRILSDLGYRLIEVMPCDQFPHTVHVETVCRLEKEAEN